MNRTRRIDPKTFRIGILRSSVSFGDPDGSESCETQPTCGKVFTIATALLSSLLPFGRLFFGFFIWLFFNLKVREQTLVTCFTSQFCFLQIDIREDANTHKVISCIFQEVSARLSKNPARVTFASDNPFSRHASNSCQGWVWRLSVSVFVHDRYSHAGNCNWSHFDHWPFYFHW